MARLVSASLFSAVLLFLAVFTVRMVLIAGAAALWLRFSEGARRRRIYLREIPRAQLLSELKATGVVLVLDALVVGVAMHEQWVRFEEPTPARTAGTFLVMFLWFEAWFYVTHRLMHLRPLFFLHRQHHVANVVNPLTAMSFSLLERGVLIVGAIGFAILASRVVALSNVGLALYFLTNYALNVWAHTNVEALPAGYPRHWLARVLNSSTYHAMHHARSRGHYGLFTPWFDRLFSSAFEDYPQVHARAASGQGLRTLGERVTVEAQEPRPSLSGSPTG